MPGKKPQIAVLISGRGSNLKRLILLQKNYEVVAVLSNRRKALGLNYAREAAIPFYIFDKRDYASSHEQQQAICQRLKQINPDLICLAGFLQILDAEIVREFLGKIINLHPALLPRLKGYFGMATHQAAIDLKEKEHGCSVHFVDEGVDTGLVIAQASCQILAGDTAETLADRVHELEHKLLPWVVDLLATGNIRLENNSIFCSEAAKTTASENNFSLGGTP